MPVGGVVSAAEMGINMAAEAAASTAPAAAKVAETTAQVTAPAIDTAVQSATQSTEAAVSQVSAPVVQGVAESGAGNIPSIPEGSVVSGQSEAGNIPSSTQEPPQESWGVNDADGASSGNSAPESSSQEPSVSELTADENLPIGDRVLNAANYRTAEENKLRELEASGADKDTIHAQERKVWEARRHEDNLTNQRNTAELQERIKGLESSLSQVSVLQESINLFMKSLEAEKLARQEDKKQFLAELQKRDELLKDVINQIKDDKEKHRLLKLLALIAVSAVGSTVSETGNAVVETTGAKA